jgi:hypothetical protein
LDITFRFSHRHYQQCLERSGTGLDTDLKERPPCS